LTSSESAGNPAGGGTSIESPGKVAGREISNGHAFDKHVVQNGEFKDVGITTREQFANHIERIVDNPSATKQLSGGRAAFWDNASSTVVIRNPKAVDGGTAFRPKGGKAYFDGLR